MKARAKVLLSIPFVLLAPACSAILGITDVPPAESATGEGGPEADQAAPPVVDGGSDAPTKPNDAGGDGASHDAGDATTFDGGGNGSPDAGPTDLSWAQWPMPTSPGEVTAGSPNPESYAGPSSGTVTDNVTGLVWELTPTYEDAGGDNPAFEWAGAMAYCDGLDLAGEQDWRLPTIIELVSLVKYDQENPAIDTTYFSGAPGDDYWSSTPAAGFPGVAWYVFFADGLVNTLPTTGTYSTNHVRCVRGGAAPFATPNAAPAGRYTVSGTGASATVYDTKTKLTWQQSPASDAGVPFPTMTQTSAVTYCAGVTINGAPARLPTIGELQTLVDFTVVQSNVAIDTTVFPGTPSANFWSATPAAPSAGSAWGVPFNTGGTFFDVTDPVDASSAAYAVRCVR